MLGLFKRNKTNKPSNDTPKKADDAATVVDEKPEIPLDEAVEVVEVAVPQATLIEEELVEEEKAEKLPQEMLQTQEKPVSKSLFSRLKDRLKKTRSNLGEGLASLFLGKKQIDDDLLEDIETVLLQADLGVDATTEIVQSLTEQVKRKELANPDALFSALKGHLENLLSEVAKPLMIPNEQKGPYVILMVGINGAGKTTTIGKLASRFKSQGKSVMLAAGDTFRAAAIEQLVVWGQRNDVNVISQHTGADSASVIFDAYQSAKAKGIDVLIADTAGRLHTQTNLMDELKKVKRVMQKIEADAPHEVLLVLDAGTGQNALNQAKEFGDAVGVSGLVMTKLDGTARGGMLFSMAMNLKLPIRFIGVGEAIDDLRPLEPKAFVEALFDE